MCYFKGYVCAVAQKKKDADVMTNYKPVEFSASCFLQGETIPSAPAAQHLSLSLLS